MKAVYTAITKGYDKLIPQPKVEGIDYVCFTDDPDLTSEQWEVIYKKNLNHKEPKILRHHTMNKYDQTLWIDANVTLKKGFEDIFNALGDNHIAVFNATLWNTVEEEIQKCVEMNYETKENGDKVRTFLQNAKYEDTCLSTCTVILRDNYATLSLFEHLWWSLVRTLSTRDQLTFNYALRGFGLEQSYFEGTVYNNRYLTWAQTHG